MSARSCMILREQLAVFFPGLFSQLPLNSLQEEIVEGNEGHFKYLVSYLNI